MKDRFLLINYNQQCFFLMVTHQNLHLQNPLKMNLVQGKNENVGLRVTRIR